MSPPQSLWPLPCLGLRRTGGGFNPSEKIFVKLDHFPNSIIGEEKKKGVLSCHAFFKIFGFSFGFQAKNQDSYVFMGEKLKLKALLKG